MQVIVIIVAGIAGTDVMTAFVYFLAALVDQRLKVIRVLGTMLTNQTTNHKGLAYNSKTMITGTIAHYMVGIGFAFVYYWLWLNGIGSPSLSSAILFGFINGIVAVAGWKTFISLHPDPPVLPIKMYLLSILISHVFFAVGVVLCFMWMSL